MTITHISRIVFLFSGLIILLVIALQPCQGQLIPVSGKITVLGEPAGGVRMALKAEGCSCERCPVGCGCCPEQLIVTTKPDGSFEFSVRPGTYNLVTVLNIRLDGLRRLRITAKEQSSFGIGALKHNNPSVSFALEDSDCDCEKKCPNDCKCCVPQFQMVGKPQSDGSFAVDLPPEHGISKAVLTIAFKFHSGMEPLIISVE